MDSKHDRHIHNEVREESVETEREAQLRQIDETASRNEDPLAQQIAELLGNETELGKGDVELVEDEGELTPIDAQLVQHAAESSAEDAQELAQSAHEEEELNRVIEELCTSKAEEFMLLGYEGVTGKDIWEFVSEQNQYHQTGIPPLHKLINDILSLRVTAYMNWLTLSAYKGLKFND